MPAAADLPLLCPVCRNGLRFTGGARTLVCGAGHSFDAARQGYFNFLVGKGTVFEADSADMVAARFDFLSAGHYQPLADAVAGLATPALRETPAGRPLVLDAGTGTGHYLRAVLDRAAGSVPAAAIGLDISKFALRRAARLNPEALNVVGDVWQPLPVAENAVDVVTVVFAPRNPPEFARVLRPGGRLVVVTPRPGHLAEVAGPAGMLGIEPAKDERLAASLGQHFTPVEATDLDLVLDLGPRDVANLAYMGPAGHHLDRAALAALEAALPEQTAVTARFRISVFQPIR
ncbi:methyltransferase domain-containing protein [Arthrobacter sp. 131MFCol6.1]|uniref:methyltransferase domain-containing protein n=1 Tax=Arthrobacter sp. 131MFCol6.1 TaxID=1157944 RepID=UPI00036E9697|nr:methyltransferase domain-containing protein [Arthrobacter sp. 131MFCol6.1]